MEFGWLEQVWNMTKINKQKHQAQSLQDLGFLCPIYMFARSGKGIKEITKARLAFGWLVGAGVEYDEDKEKPRKSGFIRPWLSPSYYRFMTNFIITAPEGSSRLNGKNMCRQQNSSNVSP